MPKEYCIYMHTFIYAHIPCVGVSVHLRMGVLVSLHAYYEEHVLFVSSQIYY